MYNEYEYSESFIDDRYIEKRNEWVYENADKFLETIKSTLNDDTFCRDIAFALASYLYGATVEDVTAFFHSHNLSYNDAICYLHYRTDKYESEIDDAFQEMLHEDCDINAD